MPGGATAVSNGADLKSAVVAWAKQLGLHAETVEFDELGDWLKLFFGL